MKAADIPPGHVRCKICNGLGQQIEVSRREVGSFEPIPHPPPCPDCEGKGSVPAPSA
jgi:DnaJ-class molecular chaperone